MEITLPDEVNVAPNLSRHAKRKLEHERAIKELKERIKKLETDKKKMKRTNRELQDLQIGSGDIRSNYRIEKEELLGSYIYKGLSKINTTLKTLTRKESGGILISTEVSEEEKVSSEFLRKGVIKRVEGNRTLHYRKRTLPLSETASEANALRADAAEKRLRSAK